ncbi:hypothetical protein RJ640_005009 [Escallonia rubra]|uniref:Protein Iojap, chloroplastic n=1 Tax=Escallonia rubra TaxID=112253 RepID=A0AA88QJR7_9ASTE|nr:hypothetical protein RJ640_005009 [Escallonia rubra]
MEVSCTMPGHASLAGVCSDNLVFGEFWQLGRVKSKAPAMPRKLSWSRVNGGRNCFQMANMDSKPGSGSLRGSSSLSPMAIGSNVGEDTDDMFDDLLEKYGKVVFKRNDQKSPIAEVDDDAESLSFAVEVAKTASDVKAGDIRVLFVKPLVYWTRFFIITTAFSRPQIDAIGIGVDMKINERRMYESNTSDVLKVVSGDVVVHIFLPEQRAYYNLEEFYGNATLIELPFENQQPFRG